nr:MAG TPA: hypothetical protein [Caudoviricetes sp.]
MMEVNLLYLIHLANFIGRGENICSWQIDTKIGKFYWKDLARFSLTTNKAICKLRI